MLGYSYYNRARQGHHHFDGLLWRPMHMTCSLEHAKEILVKEMTPLEILPFHVIVHLAQY